MRAKYKKYSQTLGLIFLKHIFLFQCQGTGSAQSSNTFQREFPKLGVDGGGQSTEGLVKERESDEKEPVSSSTSNAPPRFGGIVIDFSCYYCSFSFLPIQIYRNFVKLT